MLKSETERRLFAAIWFAAAASIPVGLYFLVPLSSGWAYLIITAVVPVLSAGAGGWWLGAGILDEKKVKSAVRAAGRGLAIAALAYLLLFIVQIIFGVIYNSDRSSDEIFRLIEIIAILFFYGLLVLGWLIAGVGAAAGVLLYLVRSMMLKRSTAVNNR